VPADGLSMRCPKCSHSFQVQPDDLEQDGGAVLSSPSKSGGKVDRLFVKRPTGKVFGPFDKNAIRMMLEAGKLSGDAEVSPDKTTWQGLAQLPEFAEFASDAIEEPVNPAGTMLGGWASSAAEDSDDLPASQPPQLPKPKQNSPALPKPKANRPSLPKPKGVNLPKPKSAELPATKSADLPASTSADADLPASKGNGSLPQAKGQDSLPQAQDSLPQAQDSLPQAQDSLPQAQDSLPQSQQAEADLFGGPDEEEDDLFGAPDDDDEDDLFGAPDDDDEDDLFGGPDRGEDDLFDAPLGGGDSFSDPVQDQSGALGDDESEDLFAAPADDDDDLFEDGGLESGALFGGDGDSGGDEDGDFLSSDSNFSFLDDSPPEGDSDEDLAGKSGDWGDDLMGDAPADEAFDTGRFDDSSGDGDSAGDSWDDDILDDSGASGDSSAGGNPLRPASSGPRQPASQGKTGHPTRDKTVQEDKKRGLMAMVGIPVLALVVLGGAGYGLYTTFFDGPEEAVEKVAEDTGPINIDLEMAARDNYGDLQATIDEARKGELVKGEEPKILLVESLFLSRYDDADVKKHAKKLADKYSSASGGWKALARGAFEAQRGSADAARSYLEPLAGESGDIGYYAQLMMGIGDVLALDTHLETTTGRRQQAGKTANDQKANSSEDAGSADESAQADAGSTEELAPNSKAHKSANKKPAFDDTAKQLAARGRTALLAATKARPKAPAPTYWLGQLDELSGDTKKAVAVWSATLEASPGHVASRMALGEAYYNRGDLNKATKTVETFLADYTQLAATQEQARAHHLIGSVHSARQRSEEAIKSLTLSLSLDTSRTDTIQALAEQYMVAEKYQEALNYFTTNQNLGKNNPDVILGTMRAHMGLEDWQKAIAQLEQGEKAFPNDARFPLYLGRLNRERRAFFDAQKALERAVEIDPQLLPAHAALAQLAWRADEDRDKAESHIEKIRRQPDQINANVATEVAAYYQMSNRPETAEKWYTSALDHDPNYWPSRLALARMYLENGEDEKALLLLENAKDEGIQDIRLSAYLADAYRQSERFAQAVNQINEVIEKFPKNEKYIFIRGRIYFDQGNFDTAREDFNKAYELDPRYHDAYFFVGRTAFEQGDFKKSMKLFRHVLDYKPNEGEYHYWMGRSYEAQDRLTQALDEYRKATTVDESYGIINPQLFVRRGQMLSKLGYSVEGKRDIARAIELRPDMLEALIAMGESNYRDQLYDTAIKNFEKIIDKNPKMPEIQYKLGMSLMHTGKELQGAKYLQNAVRFGYDDPEVFQTLGYLYKRMNRNNLAIKSFKEYLKRIATDDRVPVESKREMIRQIEELGGSF
jgi:tetratricopeptide (TPR) repeat protein